MWERVTKHGRAIACTIKCFGENQKLIRKGTHGEEVVGCGSVTMSCSLKQMFSEQLHSMLGFDSDEYLYLRISA